ncbi:MAG TPA: hypothetical protein VLH56_00270 [Dissulfurispiraceae bacterium]|nr:hypothetical protein [Dissulfurispiraceae bacterium]
MSKPTAVTESAVSHVLQTTVIPTATVDAEAAMLANQTMAKSLFGNGCL